MQVRTIPSACLRLGLLAETSRQAVASPRHHPGDETSPPEMLLRRQSYFPFLNSRSETLRVSGIETGHLHSASQFPGYAESEGSYNDPMSGPGRVGSCAQRYQLPQARAALITAVLAVCGPFGRASLQSAVPDGEAVYRQSCAACHESGENRAPSFEAMRRLSPETIFASLTTGKIRRRDTSPGSRRCRGIVPRTRDGRSLGPARGSLPGRTMVGPVHRTTLARLGGRLGEHPLPVGRILRP